jgi:hypothetical protein
MPGGRVALELPREQHASNPGVGRVDTTRERVGTGMAERAEKDEQDRRHGGQDTERGRL